MVFAQISKINQSNFEQNNMFKLGYRYFVRTEGESRSYFRTLKEAERYKKNIEEMGYW